MDLVRDLLDKKVLDRNGRDMGRVDGIVLEIRDGAPPRVAGIELGPEVLAHRVNPVLGRLAVALEHVFDVDRDRPLRVPLGDRVAIHDYVTVDVAVGETVVGRIEQRLRRWVGAIPGSS